MVVLRCHLWGWLFVLRHSTSSSRVVGSSPVPFRGDEGKGHGDMTPADAAGTMALCCTALLTPCVGAF